MFTRQPNGDFLTLDYFGTGGQLTLTHRDSIYGAANDWAVGASTLIGYPIGQYQGFARLRILFLELEAIGGYRTVWRNLSFDPGPHGEYCIACDRAGRRKADPLLQSGPDTDRYGYGEGLAQIYVPFNDNLVLTTYVAARWEDSRPRTYDWFFTSVHDGGLIARNETMLFFHHRDWGGIAPYFQVMFLPRAGHHDTEAALGFNAVTRLGLVNRDDLLFFTFLIRPGDGSYGQHDYYCPVRALFVYRLQLTL
jgi:hypothetical protein